MAYANLTDVKDRLGRPITSPEEVAQVNAWLADVESVIRDRVPDLDERVDAGELSVDTVIRVEANAVVRRIQNPGGLTSVTRSVDDAQITERREGQEIAGWITDDDWAALMPVAARGAYSTRPTFEPDLGCVDPWR